MEIFILTLIVTVLYGKTYKYNILVDDEVPRDGYLKVLTTDPGIRPHYMFYEKKRSFMYTFTSLGIFYVSCIAIYFQFGFYPAVLYAVMPLHVDCVAWATGSYYQTTTMFILIIYYIITHFSIYIAVPIGILLYIAALNSTVTALPFAFLIPLIQDYRYTVFIIPVVFFLLGNRWRTGVKKRKILHEDSRVSSGKLDIKRILTIPPKLMAAYISHTLWPSRLGFFNDNYKYINKQTFDRLWAEGIICCLLCFIWMWNINWIMCLWFFFFLALHSGFTVLGMFYAQRYTSLFNVASCVILAQVLPKTVLLILASLWAYRTWIYVKTFRNNKTLFASSCEAFPEAKENYNNLSAYYMERGDWNNALQPLLIAEKLSEDSSFNIQYNIALCYLKVGHYEKALIYATSASNNAPESKKNDMKKAVMLIENKITDIEKHKKYLKKHGII